MNDNDPATLDSDISNPAPTSQPTSEWVQAANVLAGAMNHHVNTKNQIHIRDQIAVMKKLSMEEAATKEVTITNRVMQATSLIGLGAVLIHAIGKNDTVLIHQILSVFGGIAIGGWFKK
jgi:hypothetical protein